MADDPILAFESRAHWARWLKREHAASRGVWMKIAKKGSGTASVSYAEALEVALTWGWIDGQKKSLDDAAWLQRFCPRTKRSIWSKVNREKALALIEAGKMMPPGLAEVERAKADGRWDAAYEPPSKATVPGDLEAALSANEAAAKLFATLDSRNRYAILHRVATAKRAETRAKRIASFVEMLARGEKLHP